MPPSTSFSPSSTGERPETAPEIGEASWHELMTTDAPAAMKFYQRGIRVATQRSNGHGSDG